ncbi:MAG: GntR family transcriptional regulator, partial [Pseudorhodobacter sp.]|nr:GntR family transcriptional regulator [Pseudorhodobacter sp.]
MKMPAPRLSELAYERILEGLFARKVQVGAFVSQNELSALFDIPIAPLRDALRTLEGEGVLTIHPRSGIQFVRPGLELTRATYQFRSIIERAAIRIYAEAADDAQLADLTTRHETLIARIEADGLSPT